MIEKKTEKTAEDKLRNLKSAVNEILQHASEHDYIDLAEMIAVLNVNSADLTVTARID
jgi:hypothetical protein